jgi:putative transposase
VYLLANPVAADLVDRVAEWPGACSFGMQLSGRTKTVQRPRGFFRTNGAMPETVTLRIERPEGFESLSDEEWAGKLEEAIRGEEERARGDS